MKLNQKKRLSKICILASGFRYFIDNFTSPQGDMQTLVQIFPKKNDQIGKSSPFLSIFQESHKSPSHLYFFILRQSSMFCLKTFFLYYSRSAMSAVSFSSLLLLYQSHSEYCCSGSSVYFIFF